MFGKFNTLNLIESSENEENYIEGILDLMLPEYCRIFGENEMLSEVCFIYNEPGAECPMLIINRDPIRIRLAQESIKNWHQTIFQLSHELCHYAIRQYKIDKNHTIKWFEEAVCEAMSLYILKYSAENWKNCILYPYGKTYDHDIYQYLSIMLNRQMCIKNYHFSSVEDIINWDEIQEKKRELHRPLTYKLFYEFCKDPSCLKHLAYYQEYICTMCDRLLDLDTWKEVYPHSVLNTIQRYSPQLIV